MGTFSPGRHLPMSAWLRARKEADAMQSAAHIAAAANEREVRG
jgi:hypothetical protein